jgi:membrane-associated protease RseP (regulator of RpoE activity)
VGNKNLNSRQSLNGWEASVSGNLTKWFAVEGDVSGHYKSDTVAGISGTVSDYTYSGGPRVNFKPVFAHVLIGGDRVGASAFGFTASHTGLSVAVGGGLEYPVKPHWSARVSADYVWNRHNVSIPGVINTTQTLNNVRVGVGIVYNFGGTRHEAKVAKGARTPNANPQLVTVPALGVVVSLGRNEGAEITEVAPGGAAAAAGLQPGDVINSVDGKPVKNPEELASELSSRTAGDKVQLGYLHRGAWELKTTVTLGGK